MEEYNLKITRDGEDLVIFPISYYDNKLNPNLIFQYDEFYPYNIEDFTLEDNINAAIYYDKNNFKLFYDKYVRKFIFCAKQYLHNLTRYKKLDLWVFNINWETSFTIKACSQYDGKFFSRNQFTVKHRFNDSYIESLPFEIPYYFIPKQWWLKNEVAKILNEKHTDWRSIIHQRHQRKHYEKWYTEQIKLGRKIFYVCALDT